MIVGSTRRDGEKETKAKKEQNTMSFVLAAATKAEEMKEPTLLSSLTLP